MDLLFSVGAIAAVTCVVGFLYSIIRSASDEKKKRISAEVKLEIEALKKANESIDLSDLVDKANKRNSDK